jgi:hypothetical protein
MDTSSQVIGWQTSLYYLLYYYMAYYYYSVVEPALYILYFYTLLSSQIRPNTYFNYYYCVLHQFRSIIIILSPLFFYILLFLYSCWASKGQQYYIILYIRLFFVLDHNHIFFVHIRYFMLYFILCQTGQLIHLLFLYTYCIVPNRPIN